MKLTVVDKPENSKQKIRYGRGAPSGLCNEVVYREFRVRMYFKGEGEGARARARKKKGKNAAGTVSDLSHAIKLV